MQKIIIKYLIGSKSNQTDVFELPIEEIVFGRGNDCQVVFDSDKDAYVSTRHCKITVQNNNQFLLTDLNSSNGTFVNNVKITSPRQLEADDEVQLGKSGKDEGSVKFSFSLDPAPPKTKRLNEPKPTVIIPSTPKTKVVQDITGPLSINSAAASPESNKIGEKTAERLITDAITRDRKKIINIGAMIVGAIGIIGIGVGYLISSRPNPAIVQAAPAQTPAPNPILNPTDIYNQFGKSTVLIETSWKLIHIPTGKQLFQKIDCLRDEKDKCTTPEAPWYIAYTDGTVEPILSAGSGNPIGSEASGSGFVVHEDGHILTNRHIAAPWLTSQSVEFSFPGLIKVCGDSECSVSKTEIIQNDPKNKYVAALKKWIPANSRELGEKPLNRKLVEGRYDYMDVTFPGTSLRLPAHAGPISGSADLALIKIEPTKKLQAISMDFDAPVLSGSTVTVMGYPGISTVSARQDKLGVWLTIPDVTVTPGSVGKALMTEDNNSNEAKSYNENDLYQLTINATGSGNSGGPVFNDKGQVVGVFTALKIDANGTIVSFAVPIKHAKEFM